MLRLESPTPVPPHPWNARQGTSPHNQSRVNPSTPNVTMDQKSISTEGSARETYKGPRRTVVLNQQPATRNQQYATSNRQHATRNQKHATRKLYSTLNQQSPQPATRNQQSATRNRHPVIGNQRVPHQPINKQWLVSIIHQPKMSNRQAQSTSSAN